MMNLYLYNKYFILTVKYYFDNSTSHVCSSSNTGMMLVMPTSSRVSPTSWEREQSQNFPFPSSLLCAISAIYPIDLLFRYCSFSRLKSIFAPEKSPISAMIFGNVVSTFVSSSSPSNENILTPVFVDDFLTSSRVSIKGNVRNMD